ncbi:MAG: PP2C family protein-serine/threonine phosphatase [Betaproteobacteria bacterium]
MTKLAFGESKRTNYRSISIKAEHHDHEKPCRLHRSTDLNLKNKDQDATKILPTKHIHYESGDLFMIVTDGLTDQIGGDDLTHPVSFGYRRLTHIILEHYKNDCQVIADEIRSSFMTWQGSQARRDDVTVILFKL